MKITYLGHASLAIEISGRHIIVDPYISANELASHVDIGALQADYILLTHAHGDHVLDVEAIAGRTGATIVSNAEIASYYEKKGFKSHGMNYGGSWRFDYPHLSLGIGLRYHTIIGPLRFDIGYRVAGAQRLGGELPPVEEEPDLDIFGAEMPITFHLALGEAF